MKLKWKRIVAGVYKTDGDDAIIRRSATAYGWFWLDHITLKFGTEPTLREAKQAVEKVRRG